MPLNKTTVKLLAIVLFLFFHTSVFALEILSVNVSPDTTNYYAEYNIFSRNSPPNQADLFAGDSIFFEFDSGPTIPDTIDASLVTVKGEQAGGVKTSGQQIIVITPVKIENNTTFRVIIDAAANVRNAGTAGTYTVWLWTNQDTGPVSNTYTIYQSATTVTPAAVTPNPSIAGLTASYTVGFDVGPAGYLKANESTVSIAFPSQVTVPDGELSGVTLNGTSAFATASDDTVMITSPVDIDNDGSVEVFFDIGVGLINPTSDGSYTLNVSTSSETQYVESDPFNISPAGQLSISAITSRPETVNEGGEFTFDFKTGSSGALTASTDIIYIIFQQNTYFPATISTSNILISSGGFSDNAASIVIRKADDTDDDTLEVVTPFDIDGEADVTVSLSSSAGYLNPSVAGNYTLKLSTSQETEVVQSNPYTVISTTTTVSQALITPDDLDPGDPSGYTVEFNLGTYGRLRAGTSTITLTFDNDYTISGTPDVFNQSTISVAGGAPVSIPAANITSNATNKTITVTIPSTVTTANNDNIILYVDGSTDPIVNPGSGNYTIGVKTSVETTNVNSSAYSIGGSEITINSVTLTDYTVNDISGYTFNISINTNLRRSVNDYVEIIFPQGTVLPSSIPADRIIINADPCTSVTVTQSTRTVRAYISADIQQGDSPFDVEIIPGANITNPTVPSATFYKVTMNTSKDQKLVTSSAYAITGGTGTVTGVSATANPAVAYADPAAYTVLFTTTSSGKIAGGTAAGSSTITIDFDEGTSVPGSMPASAVQVNSNVCQTVTPTQGLGGSVLITVPNGLTIDNNTEVTVNFSSDAGLSNGDTQVDPYEVLVNTSSDGTNGLGYYTITATQDLSVVSVVPSPTAQNTGSGGALSTGDEIIIEFPDNTGLPGTISLNDVQLRVNGGIPDNPDVNPTVDLPTNTLTIEIPTGMSIAALDEVKVLLNQTAGIINPTLVQGYTLDVSTTADPAETSPSYNITATSTTVSVANVTPESIIPGAGSGYTVNFNLGSRGRLLPSVSTISVTFPSGYTIDGTPGNYNASLITIAGVGPTSITPSSISGRVITFTIPATPVTNNGDNIVLYIDGSSDPITNPSAGSYTLQVKTSVETANVYSNSFTITSIPPVSIISPTLGDASANATSSYSVTFTVDGTVGALEVDVGTITITFPFNTFVPSSISPGDIEVEGTGAEVASSNPGNRSITVTTPEAIANGQEVTVDVLAAIGLQNPSIAQNYTLNVRTSSQPSDGTSGSYAIGASGTNISNLSLVITPNLPGVIGRYQYTFTTGAHGRLVAGTSTIVLQIPDDAYFNITPISPSKITVNSTPATTVNLNVGSPNDLVTITVPSSVTIGNNANVTVIIDETAELYNRSSAASYPYGVYTSVEPTIQYDDVSLPVELTSFNAKSVDGVVALDWRTESETNNAYWIIERKEIAEQEFERINKGELRVTETVHPFEEIAKIEGRGNTSTRSDYLYIDSLVVVGNIYAYRLADVSFSGEITYHNVVFKKVEAPAKFTLAQNYPNPFNPFTTIRYALAANADVELKIFNILGQEIKKLAAGIKKAGFYRVQWDGKNESGQLVASGIYIYSISAKSLNGKHNFRQFRKMILIR
jgi:hypothetical protein